MLKRVIRQFGLRAWISSGLWVQIQKHHCVSSYKARPCRQGARQAERGAGLATGALEILKMKNIEANRCKNICCFTHQHVVILAHGIANGFTRAVIVLREAWRARIWVHDHDGSRGGVVSPLQRLCKLFLCPYQSSRPASPFSRELVGIDE